MSYESYQVQYTIIIYTNSIIVHYSTVHEPGQPAPSAAAAPSPWSSRTSPDDSPRVV